MVLNFSCPNCGADMAYDIRRGQLHCDHCDHSEPVTEDKAEWMTGAASPEDAPKKLACPNCGGVVQAGDKACAAHCDFCGAPLVLTDRLQGDYRPDKIIPFTYDQTKAVDIFKKWCHNGLFAPKGFTSAKNIRNLKPVYVPYWLYNFTTHVSLDAEATRVNVFVQGDTEYTETSFYDVSRDMDLEYDAVPYDAYEQMADDVMQQVLPYRFEEMKPFAMQYLAGFVADQRDYTAEELEPLVKHQISGYAVNQVQSTITGYSGVRVNHQSVDYIKEEKSYLYLPLWFISYPYHGKNYFFAMNGQTGKVVGEPPVSKGKVAGMFAGISAVIFAVLMLIGGLL